MEKVQCKVRYPFIVSLLRNLIIHGGTKNKSRLFMGRLTVFKTNLTTGCNFSNYRVSPLNSERFRNGVYSLPILVNSSTVIRWTSPFVKLEVSGLFVAFILFLLGNTLSKH